MSDVTALIKREAQQFPSRRRKRRRCLACDIRTRVCIPVGFLARAFVRLSGHNLARFIGRIPSRLTDRLERNIERKKEANSSRFLSSVRPRMREMSFRRIKETEVASFLGKKIFGRSTDDIPSFWACVSSANIYIYTVWYTYIQWRGAFSSLPEKKTDKKASFFLSRPFVRPLLV